MHPLAFDKQGRPFALDRRTKKLLVRMFRSPGTRGTCAQVFDAAGEPLYVDVDTDQLGFRREVGYAPGLYRLDQCDADGVEIEGAPPAYVAIEMGRNTSYLAESGGDVNPLAIIERLVATQADVMKTMAAQQAALISASAEILRAPYRPALPAVAVEKNGDEKEDDGEECEDCEDAADDDDGAPADPWAALRPVMDMIEPHVPKLGAFLYEQLVAFLNRSKAQAAPPPAASSPAAAPPPMPAPPPAAATSAVSADAESVGAAAGPSSSSPGAYTTTASSHRWAAPASAPNQASDLVEREIAMPTMATSPDGPTELGEMIESEVPVDGADMEMPPAAASASVPVTATGATSPASTSSAIESTPAPRATAAASTTESAAVPTSGPLAVPSPAATPPPRNAPPEPTPAQVKHLLEIRRQLSVKEQAIAQNAMSRMTPAVLAQWLAELSALSVDDATRMLRQMIVNLRAPRNRGGG